MPLAREGWNAENTRAIVASLREHLGLSVEELAEITGAVKSTVYQWGTGRTGMSERYAHPLLRYLDSSYGISEGDLFEPELASTLEHAKRRKTSKSITLNPIVSQTQVFGVGLKAVPPRWSEHDTARILQILRQQLKVEVADLTFITGAPMILVEKWFAGIVGVADRFAQRLLEFLLGNFGLTENDLMEQDLESTLREIRRQMVSGLRDAGEESGSFLRKFGGQVDPGMQADRAKENPYQDLAVGKQKGDSKRLKLGRQGHQFIADLSFASSLSHPALRVIEQDGEVRRPHGIRSDELEQLEKLNLPHWFTPRLMYEVLLEVRGHEISRSGPDVEPSMETQWRLVIGEE